MAERLRKLTILCALTALSLVVLTPVGAARASSSQESIFQDDGQLLSGDDGARQAALDEIKAIGADTIHTLAIWSHIAPSAGSTTKPSGFDGADPSAYPAGAFDTL